MKPARLLAAALLGLIALAHALRLLMGWDVLIAGVTIPRWPSGVVAVAFLGLALALWREGRDAG